MRENIKAFVGLDVHKDSIAIAYADADFSQPPRFLGTTGYSVISLTKALGKIGKPEELLVCHEAGPCGYGLVRSLRQKGYATDVIAPSRVARQPADRIKTDRRDALLLARLLRSAELTPIVVPEPKDEAIRDLVRTREDAMHDRGRARQRLRSFLLRQGHSYTGRRWGPTHQLFLSKIKFADPSHHIAFTAGRTCAYRVRRAPRNGFANSGSVVALVAGGPGADDLARHRLAVRRDHYRRTRRSAPLPPSSPIDGISRPGPEGAFERANTPPWRAH